MIIDFLHNQKYYNFSTQMLKAFQFLQNNNLQSLSEGKYEIDGSKIFALVNSYETLEPEKENMESHLIYTDVHYIIKGHEQVGHGFLEAMPKQKHIDINNDCIIYDAQPSFYSTLMEGMFAVFFPHDVHMPGIFLQKKCLVKKVVIKVAL